MSEATAVLGNLGRCEGCPTVGACISRCPDLVEQILGAGACRIGATPGLWIVPSAVAKLIDHTLLKPDAKLSDVAQLCEEAKKYGFASVCVNPYWVRECAKRLASSPVKVCTVIGFPFGATRGEVKAFEGKWAQDDGATELDMVINIGALKSGDAATVLRDIEKVVEAAAYNTVVKVIIETAYLTKDEKVKACELSAQAGADFVKTSTGYAQGGATPEDIALMRSVVGERMGVKASGGVRDFPTAVKLIEAGASRIGASASVKIVTSGETAAAKGY